MNNINLKRQITKAKLVKVATLMKLNLLLKKINCSKFPKAFNLPTETIRMNIKTQIMTRISKETNKKFNFISKSPLWLKVLRQQMKGKNEEKEGDYARKDEDYWKKSRKKDVLSLQKSRKQLNNHWITEKVSLHNWSPRVIETVISPIANNNLQ